MRIFIGIQFDEKTKIYLDYIQDIVKASSSSGNFTLLENFHLTLRFLGEINESKTDSLKGVLDELKTSINSFKIKIGNLNTFERANKHIVFVEVIKNAEKLQNLVKKLDEITDKSGFDKRKDKFKPHITVAREVTLNEQLKMIKPYEGEIEVGKVSVMLSHRVNNVLTYTPLYTVDLINKE